MSGSTSGLQIIVKKHASRDLGRQDLGIWDACSWEY